MSAIDSVTDPEVRAAIKRMEQNPTWGKFMFRANPLNTIYYAFANRYVTERYLLRRYRTQLGIDAQAAKRAEA